MYYVPEIGDLAAEVHASLVESLGAGAVVRGRADVEVAPDDTVVAVADAAGYRTLTEWYRVCQARGARIFFTHLHGRYAVIGPKSDPATQGCIACFVNRYYQGHEQARRFALGERTLRSGWLTPLAKRVIADLTVAHVLGWQRSADPTADNSVYLWDMDGLIGKTLTLVPDPLCPLCSEPTMECAENARLHLVSRPKSNGSDRLRELSSLRHLVESSCVGRTGIVPAPVVASRFKMGATSTVEVWLRYLRNDGKTTCSGFGRSYDDARTAALLEALERYCGVARKGRSEFPRGSAASFGASALDPTVFGTYSKEQYERHRPMLRKYDPELDLTWTWGFSFARREPVLVPIDLAFYTLPDEPSIAVEGSNGCSLGSCPEEAILHALLEVIERDALMIAWYARRRLSRIRADELRDDESVSRLRMLSAAGFQCRIFDVTTDFGIPAVLAFAFREDGAMPATASAGAAHLRPESAAKKALREVCSVVESCRLATSTSTGRERAQQLWREPSLVDTIFDHGLRYCAPESREAFDFLLDDNPTVTLDEVSARSDYLRSSDITRELLSTIEKLASVGSDVVAIEQTTPELRRCGLSTFKALVSGAVPISWGANLQRFEGIERLGHAASRLTAPPHPYL